MPIGMIYMYKLFIQVFNNYILSINQFQGIKMVNIQTYDIRYTETMGKGTFVNISVSNTITSKLFQISVKFHYIVFWCRSPRDSLRSDGRHWWRDVGPLVPKDSPCVLCDQTQRQTPSPGQLCHVQTVPPYKDRGEVLWIDVPDDVPYWSLVESYRCVKIFTDLVYDFLSRTLCDPLPQPPSHISKRQPLQKNIYIVISIFKFYNLYAFIGKGIPVYNVETVRFLYREPLKLGVDDKRTNYTSFSGIGKYYVTAIR